MFGGWGSLQGATPIADCVCGNEDGDLLMGNSGKGWLVIILSCLAVVVLGFFVIPLFRPDVTDHSRSCLRNLHQLGRAINSYTSDHEERYPDPDRWPQRIIPYVKFHSIFLCPSTEYSALKKYSVTIGGKTEQLAVTYAMNERLRGLSVNDVKKPEDTVLLFESNGEKLSGGPELLPKETRHEKRRYLVIRDPYVNVLFADLHVKKIPLDDVPSLKWDPE